jgi:spore maturation protein SpmB
MGKAYLAILVLALLAILFPAGSAFGAPGDEVKMDPSVCAMLQKQMDEVTALGEASGLSDEEKIARLSSSIASSMATMLKVTKNDPDAAKIAQEWTTMLNQVLALANASPQSGTEDVAPGAKRGLDIAMNRIRPYLTVLKLMCPHLVVPDAVTRKAPKSDVP